jgi:hypothetical protein
MLHQENEVHSIAIEVALTLLQAFVNTFWLLLTLLVPLQPISNGTHKGAQRF